MDKRKNRLTKAEILALDPMDNVEDSGLRFEWIRFIDEYLVDTNGARAYKAVYEIKNHKIKSSTASVNASKLLKKANIRSEIRNRMKAQQITKPSIQAGLKRITDLFDQNPNPYTGAVANKAYETLAKLGGFVQPEASGNNFFIGNVAVFQPVVDKIEDKKMFEIIEGTGRLIE